MDNSRNGHGRKTLRTIFGEETYDYYGVLR
nr:MAG TPA: Selenoprotein, putative [Caudoviricetes sp.]